MLKNMDRVKAFILENHGSIRSIQEIAEQLEIPYETLRRQFRDSEHITLGKYVTRIRVESAKRLLLERKDLYCYQICDEVGFGSVVSGIRAFIEFTGQTMSDFRNATK